ncbi:MAG: Bax inhibitor-1/YccA family protein [Alphaproteobacteria bacterium]|jgi:FtsH-binding integral membrane protein|nr:MAG: Bax inhibitor-1/YccA family protein [Alphaproteobacteria bacterium]
MANWSDPRIGASQPGTTTTVGQDVAFDAGLRSHMLSVYNYMTSGVLLTGIVALLFAQGGENSLAFRLFVGGGPLVVWAAILAPLGVVMWLNFGINRISTGTARILFWVYAGLLGVSLSTIFFVYTAGSIATAFFATAAGFASLSLWGYTTKRDLSGMGTFLIMGLFGLIVAMLINVFMQSPAMDLAISAIGVLIFAGLTAYDTQKIKSLYFAVAGTDFHGKAVVMGALTLYLDFINLFLFLLRFMGNRN